MIIAFFGLSGLLYSQSPDKEIQYSTGQFIDGRDGKIYKTVKIGDQIWLAENFAYLPYVCPADANSCGIWVYGYDGTDVEMAKSIPEYQEYGSLYTWHQASNLCPEGWHLPSDEEWQILERNIGIMGLENELLMDHISWRGESEADDLKKGGSTGFDVLFGGWRAGFGKFNNIGIHANFWCDTQTSEQGAIERLFNLESGEIGRYWGNKNCGFSVRYVKD